MSLTGENLVGLLLSYAMVFKSFFRKWSRDVPYSANVFHINIIEMCMLD